MVDIVATDDHDNAVERSIRTVKERIRCMVQNMSCRRVPLKTVKWLVQVAIRNANQFPVNDSASDTHNSLTIVTKSPPPEHKNFNLDFGACVESFEDRKTLHSTSKSRGTPAMCVGQISHRKPGHFFPSHHRS